MYFTDVSLLTVRPGGLNVLYIASSRILHFVLYFFLETTIMCIYFFLILLIGYNPELIDIKDSVTYSACETFTRFILTRKKFRLFNNREL